MLKRGDIVDDLRERRVSENKDKLIGKMTQMYRKRVE